MITKEQMEQNKATFINLINSIEREFDKEKLIDWLTNRSDFFTAPCSTKYHASFEGGLCLHSLNVFYCLESLCNTFAVNWEFEDGKPTNPTPKYSRDSILIVSLLHDISKANFYEQYFKNVKNEETGVWEKVSAYRTKDPSERFLFGNHEQTSEYMVRSFIPLSVEESVAMLNHMGGMGFDSAQTDLSTIYSNYNLACLLHVADMISTYCLEGKL